jgi:hypothetical protein
MTVGELLTRISSRELSEWVALHRIEDQEREDDEPRERKPSIGRR